MKTFFSLLFLSFLAACSSSPAVAEKPAAVADTAATSLSLASAYSKAITDYLTLAPKAYGLNYDTVYFGKHHFGIADDFPDITLPPTINGSVIKLVAPEVATTHQQHFPNTVFVNLMGYVEKEHAQFIFVTFYNGFVHHYDHTLEYQIKDGKMILLGHDVTDYLKPTGAAH